MLLAILMLWSSLPSANTEGAFSFWQTDIPTNVGSGIGFTSDGMLFFGNCQVYNPLARKVEVKRRYPKDLCDPRRVKFSSVSPDGSILLASVTGSAPSCSGMSLRIDGRSGRILSRSMGLFFTNIVIHPKNRQYARIESRDINASEWTVGEPEQYQVLVIRNMNRSLVAESPPMGGIGISSLRYIGDGDSIEFEGHVYSVFDWRERFGEESPYFDYCSSDGSSCIRIQEGSNTYIFSNRSARPIVVPFLFHQLSDDREFAWSQDGRFFAFKGASREESGDRVMKMGLIDLDPIGFSGKVQKQSLGGSDSIIKFTWRQSGVRISYHKRFQVKLDEDSLVIAFLDSDSKALGPVVIMEGFNSFNAANQIFSKEDSVSVIESQRANQGKRVIGSWYAYDGCANPKADSIFGDGWTGLAANITCAISDEYGDHRAGGKCYQAVISNGSRALFISAPGEGYGIDSAAMDIVNSIKFLDEF